MTKQSEIIRHDTLSKVAFCLNFQAQKMRDFIGSKRIDLFLSGKIEEFADDELKMLIQIDRLGIFLLELAPFQAGFPTFDRAKITIKKPEDFPVIDGPAHDEEKRSDSPPRTDAFLSNDNHKV